ncbi:MAG: metalloregulator ArsR/SmtB family transcription factor [Patescibacteria group bacterium]
MKQLEKTLKALANKRRLAIVAHLKKNKEAAVTDIARAIKLSVKATSKHLAILSAVDILDYEQRSLRVYYRLGDAIPAVARYVFSIL